MEIYKTLYISRSKIPFNIKEGIFYSEFKPFRTNDDWSDSLISFYVEVKDFYVQLQTSNFPPKEKSFEEFVNNNFPLEKWLVDNKIDLKGIQRIVIE